jgi:hypothetical protein
MYVPHYYASWMQAYNMFQISVQIKNIILNLGVCILLRVWSGDGGFYIRLRNVTIVG